MQARVQVRALARVLVLVLVPGRAQAWGSARASGLESARPEWLVSARARPSALVEAPVWDAASQAEGTAHRPSRESLRAVRSRGREDALRKRDVAAVFDALNEQIRKALSGRGGSRTFTIHGLCKIVVQHKPATKERQGVNPFTGEPTTFKAKPARNVVKVRPLKKLKDMVA